MTTFAHSATFALAFIQSAQLNVFERFLSQAVSGIDSTGITTGMQNLAYVVLLIGFLWQMYQSALHGGDVRGLGTNLIKYVATAIMVMNYHAVFTTINQGFVNAGNWVNSASGTANLFDNWANDLKTQFDQVGYQKLWGLVSADLAGLIDALLIIVAYILYPVVIVIFGFFYMLYGSILYIFGPVVTALMPLGATNRLAKSYAENVFIWNAWPLLYGGFGALLNAVQMGQISQMLDQNSFLGALGNLEGSILIGLASIVYSLAIAVIPLLAKKIVSGDVGATASSLLGAATMALSTGIAATEGVNVGLAPGISAAGGQGIAGNAPSSSVGVSVGTANNLPAAPQRNEAFSGSASPRTAGERTAENIRLAFGGAINGGDTEGSGGSERAHESNLQDSSSRQVGQETATIGSATRPPNGGKGAASSRGPSPALMRPHGLSTWGAYHAARISTRVLVAGVRTIRGKNQDR